MLAIFQHLAKVGWKPFENRISVAASSESDELFNDTPNSSSSPRAEMTMGWVCHLSVVTPWCNIHGKGYLMIHHLVGATI